MRKLTGSRWLFGAALALLAALSPSPAAADEAIALSRFNPAPAGDRMFGVPSPTADSRPGFDAALLLDYAHNPLVFRRTSDASDVGVVVGSQLFLHLNASYALWNLVSLNIEVPLALYQGGDSPDVPTIGALASPSGAQIGDLRLGARVRLVGKTYDPFQLAVGGYVWIPTGSDADGSFVSDGSARGLPQIIAGGRTDRLVWSAAIGAEFRRDRAWGNVKQGASLTGGAGVGVLLGSDHQLQLGAELTASTVLSDPGKRTTNAEILVDARYRFLGSLEAGVGVGPGVAAGLGTPDVRVVGMIGYAPERRKPEPPWPAPPDRDHDGIIDALDTCPDVYGVASGDPERNGCAPLPPDRDGDSIPDKTDACPDLNGLPDLDPSKNGCLPDRDGDGVLDHVDGCPDAPGIADPEPAKNGCPPDRDGDGVPDAEDACPDVRGSKATDKSINGCPADEDGDSIRDDMDACPHDRGRPSADPQKNGCPQGINLVGAEVVIAFQIPFDAGKSTVNAVNDDQLDELSAVVKQHPEIFQIEVRGHADSTEKQTLKLSQSRADAVVEALQRRGLARSSLVAKGFGQSQPIDTNATPEGRQRNRRVEFKILPKP